MTEQTTNSTTEVPDEVFEWASEKQQQAVEHKPGTPLLLIGGFNSGKTTAAILHMLLLCEAFPGYKVAVLRKTFNDLKLTTRPSFEQWIKPEFVASSNEKEVVLKNGSKFLFHHLDRPDSATILKGLEINAAILDQAEQMQESTFTILLGRLGRWKGAKVPDWVLKDSDGDWPWKDKAGRPLAPLSVLLTANPSEDGDPELHWLWQRFSPESKNYHDKWAKLGYRSMTMPTTDNKFAGQQNIDMLQQQDEDYRKRFVEGVWVRSKGHLFRIDDQSLLDYDPGLMSMITNSMNLGRALDHGDSSPTCCLWYAVDEDSNIFCVAPETKILTEDLRWVEAGSVEEGDVLAGFEETPSKKYCPRKWERSVVEKVRVVRKPSYRLTMSDGSTVVCSEDHQWLVQVAGGVNVKWRTTKNLLARGERPSSRTGPKTENGEKLIRLMDLWDEEHTYGSGYLAAAFDGEGSYSISVDRKGNRIRTSLTFAQKDNPMLLEVENQLRSRSFRYTKSIPKQYEYVFANLTLTRRRDLARFLGSIRPPRLLPKFKVEHLGHINGGSFPEIVKKEFVGIMEVVAIQTSTKTYVAEGFASHNCWMEYYQAGITDTGEWNISDHRRAITQMSKGYTIKTNIADPSIFLPTRGITGYNKREKRWAIVDEYVDTRIIQENTVINWSKANNDEALSRTRLRQYLKPDENHRNPITGEMGAPHIYFIKRSPEWEHGVSHAIAEIRGAKRLQVGESDGKPVYGDDRDPKIPDHALDSVRYVVNSRPLAASIVSSRPRAMKSYAQQKGRVMITVPPIQETVQRRHRERGGWKSPLGGGYLLAFAVLGVLL